MSPSSLDPLASQTCELESNTCRSFLGAEARCWRSAGSSRALPERGPQLLRFNCKITSPYYRLADYKK